MKKSLPFFFSCLFSFFLSFSQIEYAFTIENENGTTIENNHLLEVNSTEYPNASFNFYVRNLTSETINIRAEIIEMSGTDGSMMEFCFGECYYGVTTNTIYPLSSFISVESGQVQISSGDHFFNQDPGDGDNPVHYSFRFFMVDDQGNEVVSIPELQTEYFINYQYQAQSFSISENILEQTKIFKIDNNLIINSQENLQLSIFTFDGKKIINQNIFAGDNMIDFSAYENKLFILNFENEQDIKFSKKIHIPQKE